MYLIFGGKGYGTWNPKGLRILGLCSEADLAVFNTVFDKNQSKLITFCSVNNNSKIDYKLVKRTFLKHVVIEKFLARNNV